MCQEEHYKYRCNDKHTVFVRQEAKCPIHWIPGHQKIKMIRGVINALCPDCSRTYLVRPAQTYTTYTTVPVAYTQPTSVVVVPPKPTVVVPALPAQMILPPPPPPPVPTLPQQTPGPGSGGAPLPVPDGTPTTGKWEWMKSKNCYEWVVHYQKKDGAAPAPKKQGFNTIHGADPGQLPPGWGAQPNTFPAATAKTGFNTIHGADSGPPPPGSKSSSS